MYNNEFETKEVAPAWGKQTVQPFEYVKLGYFLLTNESRQRQECELLGVPWGMLPQKISKFWCSETPFLCSERAISFQNVH